MTTIRFITKALVALFRRQMRIEKELAETQAILRDYILLGDSKNRIKQEAEKLEE